MTPTRFASRKGKIYLAAPLFSDCEKDFNQKLRDLLADSFHVYLPQEDGSLLVDMVSEGVSARVAGKSIFQADLEAIRSCDILLIVLDGRTIDEGASFELGYAFALGKQCYGLQTDPRRLLTHGNNPMIEHSITRIFESVSQLGKWADSVTEEPYYSTEMPADTA